MSEMERATGVRSAVRLESHQRRDVAEILTLQRSSGHAIRIRKVDEFSPTTTRWCVTDWLSTTTLHLVSQSAGDGCGAASGGPNMNDDRTHDTLFPLISGGP